MGKRATYPWEGILETEFPAGEGDGTAQLPQDDVCRLWVRVEVKLRTRGGVTLTCKTRGKTVVSTLMLYRDVNEDG